MEFRDQFCLKDRDSFMIDPKIHSKDARFYFGRHAIEEDLKRQVRRAFIQPGVPKMVTYGAFGSGKTQTLYHLEYYLLNEKPPSLNLELHTVHLNLDMQSKSDCGDMHMQMLEALGKDTVTQWVQKLFQDVRGDLEKELRKMFGDRNMAAAAAGLLAPNTTLLAWRWLTGQKPSNAELEQLMVTRFLGQTGMGSDMAKAMMGIGRLAERNGQKLLFFVDEVEQLHDLRDADGIESVHDYLRALSDQTNSSVGIIISSFGLTSDDMPEILRRPDIENRMGAHNYVVIPALPEVEDVRQFLTEMLAELIDDQKAEERIHAEKLAVTSETYPFTEEAFSLLCQYTSEDPVKALPRNIIRALNECAIQAWDEGKPIVDEEIVNNVAPVVFG